MRSKEGGLLPQDLYTCTPHPTQPASAALAWRWLRQRWRHLVVAVPHQPLLTAHKRPVLRHPSGYDSSAHIAEETKNAAVAGPAGLIMAIIGSFICGWAFLLVRNCMHPAGAAGGALLGATGAALSANFTKQTCLSAAGPHLLHPDPHRRRAGHPADLQGRVRVALWPGQLHGGFRCGRVECETALVRAPSPLHHPCTTAQGAAGFMIIVFLASNFCGIFCVTSNSRMLYAFARDHGIFGSRFWNQVNNTTGALGCWFNVGQSAFPPSPHTCATMSYLHVQAPPLTRSSRCAWPRF